MQNPAVRAGKRGGKGLAIRALRFHFSPPALASATVLPARRAEVNVLSQYPISPISPKTMLSPQLPTLLAPRWRLRISKPELTVERVFQA